MGGITYVSMLYNDTVNLSIESEYDSEPSRWNNWPITIRLNTDGYVTLNLSSKQFIKLKNELLSLDRVIQEERRKKNASIS